MSLTTEIKDVSSGNGLAVKDVGEIGVVIHDHPPLEESRKSLPFRQYFTDDGLPYDSVSGNNDMVVDGSSTPVEFCIPSAIEDDIFIKFLSIKLADAGAKLDKFGALTALTNGVTFEWQSQEEGTVVIHNGIQDNLEFFRLSEQEPLIVDLSGGGADAIIVAWDLSKIFGNKWGLKLTKGTTEKLIFRVNDALAGITEFNIIGYGTKVN